MARKRFNKSDAKEKIYFPFENTISPTGLVEQKAIYLPQANEWFEHVHADEPEENCLFSHLCNFNILRARVPIPKKVSKTSGKGAHRQLPKRYLEKISTNATT